MPPLHNTARARAHKRHFTADPGRAAPLSGRVLSGVEAAEAAEGNVPIDLRLHIPADTPMIDLVQFITDLTAHLGGYWDYHAPLSATPGRFELHEITLPLQETPL